jgi:hypothetical protein
VVTVDGGAALAKLLLYPGEFSLVVGLLDFPLL